MSGLISIYHTMYFQTDGFKNNHLKNQTLCLRGIKTLMGIGSWSSGKCLELDFIGLYC